MFLFLPLILGDAQFVSATYRLFKTPQDDQSEAGSVVTYKGNKICIIMTCCEKFIIFFFVFFLENNIRRQNKNSQCTKFHHCYDPTPPLEVKKCLAQNLKAASKL